MSTKPTKPTKPTPAARALAAEFLAALHISHDKSSKLGWGLDSDPELQAEFEGAESDMLALGCVGLTDEDICIWIFQQK